VKRCDGGGGHQHARPARKQSAQRLRCVLARAGCGGGCGCGLGVGGGSTRAPRQRTQHRADDVGLGRGMRRVGWGRLGCTCGNNLGDGSSWSQLRHAACGSHPVLSPASLSECQREGSEASQHLHRLLSNPVTRCVPRSVPPSRGGGWAVDRGSRRWGAWFGPAAQLVVWRWVVCTPARGALSLCGHAALSQPNLETVAGDEGALSPYPTPPHRTLVLSPPLALNQQSRVRLWLAVL
jgi:hypothetical protein